MVAITDRYRRLVEKRRGERRSALLPIRVSLEERTLFEGATLDVSRDGVYVRIPEGERLQVGTRVGVEMSVPWELTGWSLGYRLWRTATVVRVEDRTLARQVGCHPRDCGVALAFDPEGAVTAESESRLAAAVA
jgi:hypothetical protein